MASSHLILVQARLEKEVTLINGGAVVVLMEPNLFLGASPPFLKFKKHGRCHVGDMGTFI